jgi:hypothetical protein
MALTPAAPRDRIEPRVGTSEPVAAVRAGIRDLPIEVFDEYNSDW